MEKRFNLVIIIVLLLLVGGCGDDESLCPEIGSLLRVPSDFSTIQEAMDNAVAGDVVLVGPGEYNRQETRIIDDVTVTANIFMKSGVALFSSQGADLTIISADDDSSAFCIHCLDCDSQTVIDGFSLVGGRGGVRLVDSSPSIRDCVFRGQQQSSISGLTVCYPKIENNYIQDGPIYILPLPLGDFESPSTGTIEIRGNRIIDAGECSRSISLYGLRGIVEDNYIVAPSEGIWVADMEHCQIRGNFIRWRAGDEPTCRGVGIHIADCDPIIENNVITGFSYGIRIGSHDRQSNPTVTNNNIYDNPSQGQARNVLVLPPYIGGDERPEFTLMMEGNWWGSANEDSIKAWIVDHEDDPDIPETVDYDPWLTGPVDLPW